MRLHHTTHTLSVIREKTTTSIHATSSRNACNSSTVFTKLRYQQRARHGTCPHPEDQRSILKQTSVKGKDIYNNARHKKVSNTKEIKENKNSAENGAVPQEFHKKIYTYYKVIRSCWLLARTNGLFKSTWRWQNCIYSQV